MNKLDQGSTQFRITVARMLRLAGAASFALAGSAHAQEAPKPDPTPAESSRIEPSADESISELVVTGSRVMRDGYSAPTPVSVIGADEIKLEAPANIADFVNTLPSVRGSSSASTSQGSVSSGLSGISALNLRSLGTGRTLVLFDGQRSVVSAGTGQVDTNTFPQSLIERVEVVTGGASSAYGSDAIGGVVNFILDRDYTGIKGGVEYGETTYGDAGNEKLSITAGMPFASGRGHLLMSGEAVEQDGIHYKVRDWNTSGYLAMQNTPANIAAGLPYYVVDTNTGISAYTPGGLITAGPLRGTYFGVNGSVNQFAYGDRTVGQWTHGGDWEYGSSGMVGTTSLASDEERQSLFLRGSFQLLDNVELFAQGAAARFEGLSYYTQPTQTGLVIRRDNAFLPAAVRTQMVALNLQTFTMGTSSNDLPAAGSNMVRDTERYTVGANGDFTGLGLGFKWDGYYQRGITHADEHLINTWNDQRLAWATDAVLNSAGQIVCRVTLTNPANACVPLNRLGVDVGSQAGIDYVLGDPRRAQRFQQDVAAVNLSTNEVAGWAGPISLAVGAEWRKETMNGKVDPQYESGWKYGNYKVTTGEYNVKEAYVEGVVPVFKGFDFNGAVRYTDYSTSGGVTTWKAGVTYAPIDDVRFRATKSRDIRAPNMSELYAAGTARSNNVVIGGVATPFVQNLQGNIDVLPEEADTLGIGVVVQPRFAPGLAFSVDYYEIEIDGVIAAIGAQDVADYCFLQNVQRYCGYLNYNAGGVLQTIDLFYENLNSMQAKGLDVEASYRFNLADMISSFSGDLSVRAMATHYMKNVTDDRITAIDAAGSNTGSTPDWVYRLAALYKLDTWSLNLTMRGVSDGLLSTAYTECQSACPPSSTPYFTVNDNSVPGSVFFDFSAAYGMEFADIDTEFFVQVRNFFDRDPVLVANPGNIGQEGGAATVQTNRGLYDVLGRTYRLGVRMSF